jgi:hypothetical protein
MTFGDQYPDMPPKARFTTSVFHPNGVQRCCAATAIAAAMVLNSSLHPAPYPLFTLALFSQVSFSFDATAAAHHTATGAHALSN